MEISEKRLEELVMQYKQAADQAFNVANANLGASQAIEALLAELQSNAPLSPSQEVLGNKGVGEEN